MSGRTRCLGGHRRPAVPVACRGSPGGSDVSVERAHGGRARIASEEDSMSTLRVHNFSVSLDGYAAGPHQGLDDPLGVGGEGLHEWVFETRGGRQMTGQEGGETGVDHDFFEAGFANLGATIMGRNMFG